jgi:uncharacterized DUF497 family protein
MRFEWDPEKSEANLEDRGFDFDFATLIFAGPTLEKQGPPHHLGPKEQES